MDANMFNFTFTANRATNLKRARTKRLKKLTDSDIDVEENEDNDSNEIIKLKQQLELQQEQFEKQLQSQRYKYQQSCVNKQHEISVLKNEINELKESNRTLLQKAVDSKSIRKLTIRLTELLNKAVVVDSKLRNAELCFLYMLSM